MKFRLGIVMAGAVSAGAYTAGVIDYLLEALERWEKAKDQNRVLGEAHINYDHSLPMHDVIIEVMGGASAGGMTAAIATLALFKGVKPVTKRNPIKGDNLGYDAWVNLNDKEKDTMQQLLSTDDLEAPLNEGVPSLLNSKAIWAIGQAAKESLLEETAMEDWKNSLPSYISSELDIILSLCSLRGIPVDVQFETDSAVDSEDIHRKKVHRMWIHKWNAHFKLTDKVENFKEDHVLALDPSDQNHLSNLVSCAVASGAFPFGLRPVKVETIDNHDGETIIAPPPTAYLKAQMNRLFKGNKNVIPHLDNADNLFVSTIVDGGVVNNEPFGEVERILEELEKPKINEQGEEITESANYHALLMIDPFPSDAGIEENTYKHPLSIEKLLMPLFSAVRRQAMVKENDIPKCFSLNTTRSLIIPTSADNKEYPIACGSLGGFGGFFSKSFREHDFFLGRKNCQSFLRKHFSIDADFLEKDDRLPEDKRIFSAYSHCLGGGNNAMYLRFAYSEEELGVYDNYSEQKTIRYPIIPDTFLVKASSKDKPYWDEKAKIDRRVEIPEALRAPKITIEELKLLQKPLEKRIKGILNNYLPSVNSLLNPKKSNEKIERSVIEKTHEVEVEKIIKKDFSGNYQKLIWRSLLGLLIVVILPLFWQLYFGSGGKEAFLIIIFTLLFCVVLFLMLFYLSKVIVVGILTKKIFTTIISDFKKRKLLKG